MFVQIHTLTGYSSVLLNRDDTGMSKRIPYGGSVRTRTSSQSAKRRIRTENTSSSLFQAAQISVRSRETFKREVAEPLVSEGLDQASVIAVTLLLMAVIFPASERSERTVEKKRARKETDSDPYQVLLRKEISVLSYAEINYVKELVRGFCKDKTFVQAQAVTEAALQADRTGIEFKKNLKALPNCMSLDVAMFGRMTTGNIFDSVDSAVHVAHAFSIHSQSVETDFFTVVDDLILANNERGNAHLGETEITSPLLYAYYVVDWNQLVKNLRGLDNPEQIASLLVGGLINSVSTQVTGSKKGSTASYSSADLVFVEMGKSQPRTLAEAYRKPVAATLQAGIDTLALYLAGKDRMYGVKEKRWIACSQETGKMFGEQKNLDDLCETISAELLLNQHNNKQENFNQLLARELFSNSSTLETPVKLTGNIKRVKAVK